MESIEIIKSRKHKGDILLGFYNFLQQIALLANTRDPYLEDYYMSLKDLRFMKLGICHNTTYFPRKLEYFLFNNLNCPQKLAKKIYNMASEEYGFIDYNQLIIAHEAFAFYLHKSKKYAFYSKEVLEESLRCVEFNIEYRLTYDRMIFGNFYNICGIIESDYDFEKAMYYFNESLKFRQMIDKDMHDSPSNISTYLNMANTCFRYCKFDEAKKNYLRVEKLRKEKFKLNDDEIKFDLEKKRLLCEKYINKNDSDFQSNIEVLIKKADRGFLFQKIDCMNISAFNSYQKNQLNEAFHKLISAYQVLIKAMNDDKTYVYLLKILSNLCLVCYEAFDSSKFDKYHKELKQMMVSNIELINNEPEIFINYIYFLGIGSFTTNFKFIISHLYCFYEFRSFIESYEKKLKYPRLSNVPIDLLIIYFILNMKVSDYNQCSEYLSEVKKFIEKNKELKSLDSTYDVLKIYKRNIDFFTKKKKYPKTENTIVEECHQLINKSKSYSFCSNTQFFQLIYICIFFSKLINKSDIEMDDLYRQLDYRIKAIKTLTG